MANGLKVRGVTYRNFDEVEAALKELGAQYVLLQEDDERTQPLAAHISELLFALPDERADEIAALFLLPDGSGEAATAEPLPQDEVEIPDGMAVGRDGTIGHICPMCLANGVLEVEPPQDPTARTCPACSGYGQVATGSRVVLKATRACPICNGDGFIPTESDVPLPPPTAKAADVPEWPGALWDAQKSRWNPPDPEPPWDGATWNDLAGRWQ